jgi:LPXTG-motif cell wall-anchored protein
LGEAITATFKLYSRLQSTSEVINAPSLYGFSVMDILNINEAHQAVETIDGKIFNTSILRKLQLYPAQTGKLTIDEMQLQNSIEFNDSVTGKKIKVEKLLASNPVEITVKPLPSKEPTDYTGAVGQFSISANLANSKIAANTQGKLIVTITGKGNFIQFGPPVIDWPKEFDVFDPVVSDEVNKNIVPTEGKRAYIFSFATDQIGNYSLAPVSFPFFDPFSGQFKKITSDSLKFEITAAKENANSRNEKRKIGKVKSSWLYFIGLAALLIAALFLLWKRKKQKVNLPSVITKTNYQQKLSVISANQLSDKAFYSEIQKLLNEASKEYNLTQEQKQGLQHLQNECQLLIYSDIHSEGKKEEIQKIVGEFLKQLES